MTLEELYKQLGDLDAKNNPLPIVAEHHEPPMVKNIKSNIVKIVVENGQVVLVTDHAI